MRSVRDLSHLAYGAFAAMRNLLITLALTAGVVTAEPVTVAALGDSLTQGYGLEQGEGFVPQMEIWLKDHGAEVVLINAGVSGDTTAGGLSRVAWTLTPEVDAMIVTLGGNDLLRGIDPAASRQNIEGILKAAEAAGVPVLLVGMEAPGNYGPDYKAAFEAIYPELAEKYGALFVRNFLAPIAEKMHAGEDISTLMQADGLHPNAQGVKLVVEALGPKVLELIGAVES
jgi:acyl-CoA thioesterase-1